MDQTTTAAAKLAAADARVLEVESRLAADQEPTRAHPAAADNTDTSMAMAADAYRTVSDAGSRSR
jgi:hypothetical protein